MGWVKTEVNRTSKIFEDVISKFGEDWNGYIGDSSTPCEYFSDYLRNYYDLTLKQCDLICEMIKQHYHIEKFYAKECYGKMESN
jgi:hypothetical protein